jgi:hypothetical protein
MISLHITRTAKSYSPSDDYRTYDTERKWFDNMADAKDFLKEEYGNCKRSYMYRDTKNGESKRIGYIYGFRHKGDGYYTDNALEQHWISFQKVTDITI